MAHSSGEKPELVLQGVNCDTKEGILLMYFKFEHCCLTANQLTRVTEHLFILYLKTQMKNIFRKLTKARKEQLNPELFFDLF